MSNVVEFPKQHAREWIELERDLRAILRSGDIPQDQASALIQSMKESFFAPVDADVQLTPPFPPTLTEADVGAIMSYITAAVEQAGRSVFLRVRRNLLIRQAQTYLIRF